MLRTPLRSSRSTLLLGSLALLLAAVPALAGDPPAAPAPAPAKAAEAPKPVYDEKADAAKDIARALTAAQRDHSRVLIQWGANWCGWCKMLHALSTSDKDVSKKLRDEYIVVHVDVGRFDKHMEIATKYGADLKKNGLPYLTVLDAEGAVVVNHETGSLEKPQGSDPPGHDKAKVIDFLTKHQAPAAKAADVLAAGVAKAREEGKLVFLHFGAPWCGWCHKLEDWMARPEINAILAKAFVDVKIDTDRMTGGQDLLNQHSAGKSGGIPWFEFVDGEGKALVNSNGPKGNTGFPAAAEEVAWFVEMIKKAGAKLSAEDIATLEASLKKAK
jgi:thiol:disulfide interchange protein